MSDGSDIEWTEATWNPVRGCVKVSLPMLDGRQWAEYPEVSNG